MNLYLVSQDDNQGYDSYDSFVVAAETESKARLTFPRYRAKSEGHWDGVDGGYDWTSADKVKVKYIGIADESLNDGEIVCSSFNAG